jgi:hypothetical protein
LLPTQILHAVFLDSGEPDIAVPVGARIRGVVVDAAADPQSMSVGPRQNRLVWNSGFIGVLGDEEFGRQLRVKKNFVRYQLSIEVSRERPPTTPE